MIAADIYHARHAIPDYGASYPLLRNASMMPPEGGWSVTVLVNGRTHLVEGSPRRIAEKIHALYLAHGFEITTKTVWDYLNMVWIRRAPSRALQPALPEVQQQLLYPPRPVWTAFFSALAELDFNAERFKILIDYASSVSDPANKGRFSDQDFYERITKARIEIPNVDSMEKAKQFIKFIGN